MRIGRVLGLLVVVLATLSARADNELRVEPRRVPADESVRITLVLRDSFASIDSVELPLENLELKGPASTSVEMAFINGVTTRRKTLTWWAAPKGEGPARVGPLVLTSGSARDELPAIEITVAPQPVIDSTNLSQALDQLYMTGRDQVLIAVDVPEREFWEGEAIEIGWNLYTAASIRRFAIASSPKLDGFWVEEEPLQDSNPEEVTIGGHTVQRIAIRRATLFPLRAGTIEIPAMEAGVEVIRPLNDPFGGFSILDGRVADVRRRTAAKSIVVRPLPGEFDAVGAFTMRRSPPKVSQAGTVAFDVTVIGNGNLRAAKPPRWQSAVDGEVQVEELGTEIVSRSPITMSRRWRYVVFPRSTGRMTLPGLELRSFDPSSGTAAPVVCAATQVVVTRSVTKDAQKQGGDSKGIEEESRWLSVVSAAVGLLACTLLAVWLLRGKRNDATELEALVSLAESPRELRRALADLATRNGRDPRALFSEVGELGDAWRSIHSLSDLIEKEPTTVGDSRRELKLRALRLLPLMGLTPN